MIKIFKKTIIIAKLRTRKLHFVLILRTLGRAKYFTFTVFTLFNIIFGGYFIPLNFLLIKETLQDTTAILGLH